MIGEWISSSQESERHVVGKRCLGELYKWKEDLVGIEFNQFSSDLNVTENTGQRSEVCLDQKCFRPLHVWKDLTKRKLRPYDEDMSGRRNLAIDVSYHDRLQKSTILAL